MRLDLALLEQGTRGRVYLSGSLIFWLVFMSPKIFTVSWGMAKKNSTSVKSASKSTPALDVLGPEVADGCLAV